MTTTPHAAAAAAARQRLAAVLGTLQQNPNVPPQVLDILSGLARAMGPLFQLERGSTDLQLFQAARGVLQETLEKIQVADQGFPGVAEATEAVAGTLGLIFKAMREAGVAPGGQPAAAPQPAANPMPLVSQQAQQPFPLQQPAQPVQQPFPLQQQQQQPMQPPPQQAYQQPAGSPFAARPAAAPQPASAPKAPPGPPAGAAMHGGAPAAGSVPVGPNGLPRLESEIGVHSETNFFTDFLGDIRANGGIFVATFHVLPLGAKCEVLLTFPGNLTAEIRGTVKWKRENAPGASLAASPGLGIEISQADAGAWDLIDRFIRKREPIMHEM